MLQKCVVYVREGYKHIGRKYYRQLEAICWIDNRSKYLFIKTAINYLLTFCKVNLNIIV